MFSGKRLRLNRRGATLITALVALVVMALGVLGVIQVFLRSMKNNSAAGGVSGLMYLGEVVMERVMLLPDNSALLDGSGSITSTDLNMVADYVYDTNKYDFTCTTSTSDVPAGTDQLVKVTVEVRYTEDYAKLLGLDDESEQVVRMVLYRYHD
ncbi:MAG TPA: hypothetical protein PLY66_11185 [Acidobacteriota bacterium]|nr:hypothetical protein [Acidobacteriota bacterium]HOT01560.1 hypothetical protein [Acidobacteriota bacterium]HQF86851.1 hypothetical protein [Acidobacteriota bacterium]HQG91351.1 hypothetical protein [Acidobacteriota bacterium]HQK86627.1 hypothetical protein [Acidobacteriota bacterium]